MPVKTKYPKLDPAHGALLSRKEQMGVSLKDIAEITGINYGRLRRIWAHPPIEWNYDDLERVLQFMGLEAQLVIKEKEVRG